MTKPKEDPGSPLPAPRKATRLEREPTPYVLPPERTSHWSWNINVEVHRIIGAIAFLILVVAAVV